MQGSGMGGPGQARRSAGPRVSVSIVMPCRNERRTVAASLDSLLAQRGLTDAFEILVADGLSTDGTTEILREYADRHCNVRVFANHDRNVPQGLNMLVREVRGDYIVRGDAHCVYPPNYAATLIQYLEKTGADHVGPALNTAPASGSLKARIIASCMRSRFGVGRSFRTLEGSQPVEVETVAFGVWRRQHFLKYGLFDKRFLRAQDLEYNIRVKRMGGHILCLPWLKVRYFARESFRKLAAMSFQYGYWKIPVKQKHPIKFSARQYFPAVLALSVATALLFGPMLPALLWLPAVYCAANAAMSLSLAWKDSLLLHAPLYFWTFSILHFGYGLGYLVGICDVLVLKRLRFAGISR